MQRPEHLYDKRIHRFLDAKFKTKMCRNDPNGLGICPYGRKCLFAHGTRQLRKPKVSPRAVDPKQKLNINMQIAEQSTTRPFRSGMAIKTPQRGSRLSGTTMKPEPEKSDQSIWASLNFRPTHPYREPVEKYHDVNIGHDSFFRHQFEFGQRSPQTNRRHNSHPATIAHVLNKTEFIVGDLRI